MKMFSRTGKNTVNNHFEFVKAASKQRESQLNEQEMVKPKIQTGLCQSETKTYRKGARPEHKKTIEINMSIFGNKGG